MMRDCLVLSSEYYIFDTDRGGVFVHFRLFI